jgi:hypothetical protein
VFERKAAKPQPQLPLKSQGLRRVSTLQFAHLFTQAAGPRGRRLLRIRGWIRRIETGNDRKISVKDETTLA